MTEEEKKERAKWWDERTNRDIIIECVQMCEAWELNRFHPTNKIPRHEFIKSYHSELIKFSINSNIWENAEKIKRLKKHLAIK